MENQMCSWKALRLITASSACRLFVVSCGVTSAEWAAWITLKETREEKTRTTPHRSLPPLFTLPHSGLQRIHPLSPLWGRRLYLGVHLTLHYSECAAAAMRPELSVRHRAHAAPCRTRRTWGALRHCLLLISPSVTRLSQLVVKTQLWPSYW